MSDYSNFKEFIEAGNEALNNNQSQPEQTIENISQTTDSRNPNTTYMTESYNHYISNENFSEDSDPSEN